MSEETRLDSEGIQTALLQWAIKNTPVPEDNQDESKPVFRKPHEIGKEWYEAIFGKSDVERLREVLDALKEASEPERIVDLLESLHFLVEMTHNANDLYKIGGLESVLDLLYHEDVGVRTHTLWVLATCASNNPEFQRVLLDNKGFERVLTLWSDCRDAEERGKALLVVSAMTRHCQGGIEMFLAQGGLDVLAELLASSSERMQRKISFMLKHLVFEHSELPHLQICKQIRESRLLAAMIQALELRDTDLRENLVSALHGLAQDKRSCSKLEEQGVVEVLSLLKKQEDERMRVESDYDPREMLAQVDEIILILSRYK